MLVRSASGRVASAVRTKGYTDLLSSATRASFPVRPFSAQQAAFSSSNDWNRSRDSRRYGILAAAVTLALGIHLHASPPVLLDAPATSDIASLASGASSSSSPVRLEASTQQPLPVTLPQPQTATGSKELTLVGLGVRTVSFLRVRVYVAGLYVDAAALRDLASTPGWRGFEAEWMMGGKTTTDSHPSSEELVNALLDRGIACAIRIVPVRSTDYSHLRDGFTRSIQSRAKLARKAGVLSAETDEALSHALQALKEVFPKASLAKGSALDLIFTPSSTPRGLDLTLEEGGKILGSVRSLSGGPEAGQYSVARQLLLAYFADKDEISRPFKESVAQGFRDCIMPVAAA